MSTGVDRDDRVGGDHRVVFLDPKLDRVVEILTRRLVYHDRLGKQRRLRLRRRRRRFDEGFRKRAVNRDRE